MNGYNTGGSAVPGALGTALLPRQQVTGIRGSPHTTLTRRIGSTTYKVSVHFQENGSQTMADKILHMIQNEGLATEPTCGTIDMPQVSRQSEGSA